MNFKKLVLGSVVVSAVVVLCLALTGGAPAEDKPQEKPAPPATTPEAGPADLVERITELRTKSPEGNTREEVIADVRKIQDEVIEAADRLLEDDQATPQQVALAVKGRLQALLMLERAEDETARERYEETIARFAADQREEVRGELKYFEFRDAIMKLAEGDAEGVGTLLDELETYLKGRPMDVEHFSLAFTLSKLLDQFGEEKLAMRSYRSFAAMYTKSDDLNIRGATKEMENLAKRLEIIGSPLEISGTLVEGGTFDWEKYRGKVVLVDFWATWCGPCLAELPNVRKNYEEYHDQGFEIVGISLDDDAEKLTMFLEKEEILWETLFSHDSETSGWAHPMATEYGVTAIPAMFLVDQEGNVITLSARGPNLEKRLEELLGSAAD